MDSAYFIPIKQFIRSILSNATEFSPSLLIAQTTNIQVNALFYRLNQAIK
jgi:hypothetical protein